MGLVALALPHAPMSVSNDRLIELLRASHSAADEHYENARPGSKAEAIAIKWRADAWNLLVQVLPSRSVFTGNFHTPAPQPDPAPAIPAWAVRQARLELEPDRPTGIEIAEIEEVSAPAPGSFEAVLMAADEYAERSACLADASQFRDHKEAEEQLPITRQNLEAAIRAYGDARASQAQDELMNAQGLPTVRLVPLNRKG